MAGYYSGLVMAGGSFKAIPSWQAKTTQERIPMIINEENSRHEMILAAAKEAMSAARTAPKTRGIDNLIIKVVDGEDVERVAAMMEEVAARTPGKRPTFVRDAGNVRASQAIILIGAKQNPVGLDCTWCGFSSCERKGDNPKAQCVFNVMDLGIALGSVGALLADKHIDNRFMYSIGYAALDLKLFPPEVSVALGIPLSVSGKSPYYDRK